MDKQFFMSSKIHDITFFEITYMDVDLIDKYIPNKPVKFVYKSQVEIVFHINILTYKFFSYKNNFSGDII